MDPDKNRCSGGRKSRVPHARRDMARDETTEMLAAIDEGVRSLNEHGVMPLEEVRKKIPQWAAKAGVMGSGTSA